jgi:hypothetical protein
MKVLAFVIAFSLCIPYGFAQEVGKITYVEGRVDILKPGSDKGTPVREYENISVGDSLRTKSNSKAEIKFKDDSIVRLAQNSKVEIKDYQLDEKGKRKLAKIMLERGKVRTIVTKMPHPADFAILTPNTEGVVKGSDVFAFYQAGSSGLLVAEGKVALTSIMHPQNGITVPAGNSALVPLEKLPEGPRPYLELEKKLYEDDTDIPFSGKKGVKLTIITGNIAKFSGSVQITNQGQSKAHEAKLGEIVKEGDLIETGDKSLVEIRLDNNNAINMKPNSKLFIVKLAVNPATGEYENIFDLTIGKIKARIEGLKGKSKFEVKTPLAICGARGTILYVDASATSTNFFLEGGNGYMINTSSGALNEIPAGIQGSVNEQGGFSTSEVNQDQRQGTTEGWDPGSGIEGYSAPEGTTGTYLYDSSTDTNTTGAGEGGNTANIGDTAGTAGTTNPTGGTTPTVDVPFTETNPVTTTTTNPTFNLGIFDTTNNTLSFAASESFWQGTASVPLTASGSFTNPNNYSLWQGSLDITLADGTRIWGGLGGIDLDNSLEGIDYLLYVRPNGETGYLSDDLIGTFDPLTGTFSASGDLTAYKQGITTITPSQLISYLDSDTTISGKVGGDLFGTLNGELFGLREPIPTGGTTGLPWSLWRATSSGTYTGTMPANWKSVFGDSDDDDYGVDYAIIHTEGTALPSGKLSGTVTGYHLQYEDAGPFDDDSHLDIISGNSLGTYGLGSWQLFSAGTSNDNIPLSFGGETTHEAGVDYALFGGTGSLWTGSPDILFIGDYSAQGAPARDLWRLHTLGRTSDGASIYGMAGGTKLNNTLKGLMYAIYVRPDPANPGNYLTGYLKSTDISGDIYPDIGVAGMFEADGSLTATQKGQTAVSPGELWSYMYNDVWNNHAGPVYRDAFSGNIGGDLAGTFSGESISISYSLTDQMWSIGRFEATGTYQAEPQGAWHAVFGGHETDSGDTGYFLGHINGPAWSGNEFSGNLTIKDIWYSPDHFEVSSMGSMTGESIGTYANGTWSATNFGFGDELPLAFGGEVMNPVDGRFGYYDSTPGVREVFLNSGSLSYLFGGTQSLWQATPAQVTLMGEYTNPGNYKLFGYEWVTGDTTDGAKLLGTIGGTNVNNILKGMSVMLYVRPNPSYNPSDPTSKPYLAGYIRSNDIGGNFYQDIGMLYATGNYTHYLDVPTDILPSELYVGSPRVHDEHDADDYGLIGGDISGNLTVSSTELIEPSGNEADWEIWRVDAGGTFNGTPSNNWHAVIGGKDTNETTGALEGYWLGDINGNSWSADGSLSASVSGVWIDKFFISGPTDEDYIGTFQGNLLGFHDANTWQALSLGANPPNTPLTFGGESPKSEFGYYDPALQRATFPPPGSLSYVFGGTTSPWTGPAQMTIIGEYSNPDNYKLWDNEQPLLGYTSDGARFYTGEHGYLAGTVGTDANNSSQALFYAFYVRPNASSPTGYSAGYLKSTDISGNFYPSIGMFKLQGNLTHYLDLPTTILPEQLYDGSPYLDKVNSLSRGSLGASTFSGHINTESYSLDDQNWGLWTGESGGTYSSIPTDYNLRIGGYSVDTETQNYEIDGYWLGTGSSNVWQNNRFSGTFSGTALTSEHLKTFNGESLGTYENGNWQAVMAGEWQNSTDLTSSGRFVAQGWNVPTSFDFAGQIGLVGPLWAAGATPDFISLGEFNSGGASQFAWAVQKEWYYPGGGLAGEDGFVSRFYDNDDPDTYYYTTYNDASGIGNGIGAFYGLSAGVGGAGKLKGKSYALYISPTGAAGTLSGDVDGNYYANVETYRLAGELTKNLHTPNIGISAENLRVNICWDNLIGTDDSGEFGPSGGPYFGDITANGFNGTMLNIAIPNATWGVWNFVTSGDYTGPIQNAWHIYDLTGMTTTVDDNYVGGSWYGGILGNKWNSTDGIEGTLDAMWIGLRKDGTLCGRKITGDAVGNYVEVSVDHGTWQAGAAGEWVELNADLTMGNLNQNIIDLSTAANVPVTVAYSSIMTGAGTGGITSATMDMRLYGVGVADGIWAAIINGYYSNVTNPAGWSATVVNGSDSVTLTGTQWDIGQWAADVVGTAGGNNLTGQAAGTYNPGDNTFTGAGTGTYTTP